MARKPSLPPPRPDLIRRPTGRFGWLEDRLLHDGWLARLGPQPTSVLVLLALAADQHGASFYGRERMAAALGIHRPDLDRALARLLELKLIAHRPWQAHHPDGIWQLLPLPAPKPPRGGEPTDIGTLLDSLPLPTSQPTPRRSTKAPHSRAS